MDRFWSEYFVCQSANDLQRADSLPNSFNKAFRRSQKNLVVVLYSSSNYAKTVKRRRSMKNVNLLLLNDFCPSAQLSRSVTEP